MSFRLSAVLLLVLSAAASADTLYRWIDKDGGIHYTDLPPQFEVRRLEERQVGSGNFVETSGPSYSMSRAQRDFPVTLYVAPDCVAECKTAREFLGKRGVAYSEVNITSAALIAQFKGLFGGAEVFLPAVTVGSQKIKGFEEGAWTRMLDEAGYPKDAPASAAATKSPPRTP